MNVYFDTEFASLEKKNGHRYLISIGCAAQNGSEWYAEATDTWDESLCSMFTIENVLPHLQGGDSQMRVEELATQLKAWIEGISDSHVRFYSDAPLFDWPFLEEIFNYHGWPQNLERGGRHVYDFESEKERFLCNAATADFWRTSKAAGAVQHHALWDARCIRFAHQYATRITIEDMNRAIAEQGAKAFK